MYGELGLKAESPEPGVGQGLLLSLPSGGMKLPQDVALPPRSTCPIGKAQAALDLLGSQLRSIHPTPPMLSGSFARAG